MGYEADIGPRTYQGKSSLLLIRLPGRERSTACGFLSQTNKHDSPQLTPTTLTFLSTYMDESFFTSKNIVSNQVKSHLDHVFSLKGTDTSQDECLSSI